MPDWLVAMVVGALTVGGVVAGAMISALVALRVQAASAQHEREKEERAEAGRQRDLEAARRRAWEIRQRRDVESFLNVSMGIARWASGVVTGEPDRLERLAAARAELNRHDLQVRKFSSRIKDPELLNCVRGLRLLCLSTIHDVNLAIASGMPGGDLYLLIENRREGIETHVNTAVSRMEALTWSEPDETPAPPAPP